LEGKKIYMYITMGGKSRGGYALVFVMTAKSVGLGGGKGAW
jgi:hypothetical protein